MTAPTIKPFTDDHVAAAGELLAKRHRRQRLVESLLSPRYEDPAEAAVAIADAWSQEGAAGAVAVWKGELVGYMIGSPKQDDVWGPNQWVENAGYATSHPELIRDLYAHLAAAWVESGRTRHYAVVPATDPAAVDAWFRLSFGQQRAYGIRDIPNVAWPANVREATADDTEALIELGPLVEIQHAATPTFSGVPDTTPRELRDAVEKEIASPQVGSLVAEFDDRVVGGVIVAPLEDSDLHTGLARIESQCILGWQATAPDVRDRGIGVALVEGAFVWARGQGYTTMVTDWRTANLLASRFWPRRGFRTSFLGLYRSIP